MWAWKIIAVATLLKLSCETASAAILAQYNFESPASAGAQATVETNDATVVPGVNVSALASSSPAGYFMKRNNTSVSQFITGSVDNQTWSIGAPPMLESYSINTSNHLSLTLTPDPLMKLDLTNLTLRMGVGKTGGSGGQAFNIFVLSSLDNYATLAGPVLTVSGLSLADEPNDPIWETRTINLSSLGSITSPITLRFYHTDGTSNANTKHGLLDTLILEGNVTAVPEPTTWAALWSVLLLSCWMMLHRKYG
jgi:hypothetical protein